MTMPYSPSRAIYEGNSAATRFPFSFKVWDASQLVVTLTSPGGVTTEASGWTADLGASGGEIVYLHGNAALPAGWKLAVTRDMPFTQEVNLVSASRFDPQVIEDALDQATAERQQVIAIGTHRLRRVVPVHQVRQVLIDQTEPRGALADQHPRVAALLEPKPAVIAHDEQMYQH